MDVHLTPTPDRSNTPPTSGVVFQTGAGAVKREAALLLGLGPAGGCSLNFRNPGFWWDVSVESPVMAWSIWEMHMGTHSHRDLFFVPCALLNFSRSDRACPRAFGRGWHQIPRRVRGSQRGPARLAVIEPFASRVKVDGWCKCLWGELCHLLSPS